MNKQQAMEHLALRWRQLFAKLAAGQDVPPSQRLRLEGMMEMLVLLGLAQQSELDGALSRAYRGVFHVDLADEFGADWRQFYPFPQIPGNQQRAPVFTSTPD